MAAAYGAGTATAQYRRAGSESRGADGLGRRHRWCACGTDGHHLDDRAKGDGVYVPDAPRARRVLCSVLACSFARLDVVTTHCVIPLWRIGELAVAHDLAEDDS